MLGGTDKGDGGRPRGHLTLQATTIVTVDPLFRSVFILKSLFQPNGAARQDEHGNNDADDRGDGDDVASEVRS